MIKERKFESFYSPSPSLAMAVSAHRAAVRHDCILNWRYNQLSCLIPQTKLLKGFYIHQVSSEMEQS